MRQLEVHARALILPAASVRGQSNECATRLAAIDVQQRTIVEARRILSADEAGCAFADFTMPVTGDCARVKAAAERDTNKRRAWRDILVAWAMFDRLRLELRSYEQRSGVFCSSP